MEVRSVTDALNAEEEGAVPTSSYVACQVRTQELQSVTSSISLVMRASKVPHQAERYDHHVLFTESDRRILAVLMSRRNPLLLQLFRTLKSYSSCLYISRLFA